MADRTWDGSTSGDWGVAANWTPATVPVNGDDVFFSSGSVNVDAGLAQGAVTLGSLRIGSQYTGNIGSSGNYLVIGSTLVIFNSGGAECWLDGAYTTLRVLNGISSANMLQVKGDTGTLRVLGGNGTITYSASSTTLDVVEIFGAEGITVAIPSGVTSLDNVTVDSGVLTCGAPVGTLLNIIGGLVKITDSATVNVLDLNGGVSEYNTSGTLTELNAYQGKFTIENNTSASVTITAATMYEGSTVNFQNALDNLTLTAGITRHGGLLLGPNGKLVTFS